MRPTRAKFSAFFLFSYFLLVAPLGEAGIITTVAGGGPYSGWGWDDPSKAQLGDGGPATGASFNSPFGLAIEDQGNLYISDTGNYRVRRVDSATGIITTIAGNGIEIYSGDGGLALEVGIPGPFGLAWDRVTGDIYVGDDHSHTVRKIDRATGVITRVAGIPFT